jgi:nicotinamidase-related amidase
MSKSALLIIDVQQGLVARAHQAQQLLDNLQDLLAKARAAQVPVIYMQHDGDSGETLEPNQAGWEIHPAIMPANGERVIRKRASDSFYETPLESELHTAGISHLLVTGMRTERCVDTTARVAVSKGFDVTLISDAHSTSDGGTFTAAQIITHTNENLEEFGNDAHEIAVVKTDEVVF